MQASVALSAACRWPSWSRQRSSFTAWAFVKAEPAHICPQTISGVLCCLQVAFMEQAVPMLDALGFVERYAWYFLSPDQAYDGHNGLPLDTASLYLMNGSATPTGQAYSSF